MAKTQSSYGSLRLNLIRINESFEQIEMHWKSIDDKLDKSRIGRKDTPFSAVIRQRMLSAYTHVDYLLEQRIHPFSDDGILEMFVLNNRVHYGNDIQLMREYRKAIDATYDKFRIQIVPFRHWYQRHKSEHPLKLAAESYVSILGFPQLFNEGNHRTGALVASWISLYYGFPPFVLSVDNALAFFAPSSEIKKFINKSTWRGRAKLPKYHRVFRDLGSPY